MAELVKRNNGGRLDGQLFSVDFTLIEKTRQLAPQKWGEQQRTARKIAKMIVNGVAIWELDLIKNGQRTKARAVLTLPGNKPASVPLVVETENGRPKFFLDTCAEIKNA